MQTTSNLLMIKPIAFGLNTETATSNAFQNKSASQNGVQEKALEEFNALSQLLIKNQINVLIIDDTLEPHTPDSIFPNNWISFHEDGNIFLYPMEAKNRRLERRADIVEKISHQFEVKNVHDLSHYENQALYLEGTGSMVLDRENKIAYACISSRTNDIILKDFCEKSGYTPCIFKAVDQNNLPIYHTNVVMCIGEKFVVIGLDTIKDEDEKATVLSYFHATKKEIINLSNSQIEHFAGNMLAVKNIHNQPFLIMSSTAYKSLLPHQIEKLAAFTTILHSPLHTIEENGGGSARCMIAEIHLNMKSSN